VARQTRHTYALRKRDFKQHIVILIGVPINKTDAASATTPFKKQPNSASRKELHALFNSGLVLDKGNPARIDLPTRTLQHYLEELRKENLIILTENDRYELTELGKERLSFLMRLHSDTFGKVPIVDPLGISFGLVWDKNGKVKYVDILMRVSRPDVVQAMEEAISKRKFSENEKVLGRILCTVILWDLKGVLPRLADVTEGHEDVLLQILGKLPYMN
jgi:predicted transcriptional regulator